MNRAASLSVLADRIAGCSACTAARPAALRVLGTGPLDSGMMLVGEAPGWNVPWDIRNPGPVTIVALSLTGQETADDLRRLAEVFEVREALRLRAWRKDSHLPWHTSLRPFDEDGVVASGKTAEEAIQAAAERLHSAGWRPGMTAEDAARLLAEVRHG